MRPVLGDHELDGAGVAVVDGFRERDGVAVERGAGRLGKARRRGDLHDLLVAALDRAVALVEVHDAAVVVGEDLHLDVPGVFH